MWAHLVVMTMLGFAQPGGFDGPSLAMQVFQLDGYLDEAPAGKTIQAKLVLGNGSVNRLYLITKTTIETGGDPDALYRNQGMQKPDFVLVGPEGPLGSILSAKKGAHLSGAFYYRRGINDLEFDPKSIKIE